MELDGFEGNTPAEPRSPLSGSSRNTPAREDAEKGIIVDAPTMESADSSAILLNPDDEDEDDIIPRSPPRDTKRKRDRQSVNYAELESQGLEKIRGSPRADSPLIKRPRAQPKVRGVPIGVWRDSSEPNDNDKHVIFGFIDIHDRLRTRIYAMNKKREELIGNVPTGAGGCWVTFPRIIFEQHLASLNSAEIKEYVKLRTDVYEATEEERIAAEGRAVALAKQIASDQAASPGNKPIVHRPSVARQSSHRQSLPRQPIQKTPSFQAVNTGQAQSPKQSPSGDSKSPGVLLGYWADSTEVNVADKHACYGVLSGSDCFRVKVQRCTRDGRYVDGNFPVGAGALWLHYDKVVMEPHLQGLSRPEVKEYCRIRNYEQEQRETEKERKANELKAVQAAKAIVATQVMNGELTQTYSPRAAPPPLEMETRHSARAEHKHHVRQQAELEAAAAAARSRQEKLEATERQHEKARKEVAAAENNIIEHAAQMELKHNLKKLNKVWVAQNRATHSQSTSSNGGTVGGPPPVSDEIKYHNGIKYERKQNGPFAGKLVGPPQILSIDGEDYVEYRILTKPSF